MTEEFPRLRAVLEKAEFPEGTKAEFRLPNFETSSYSCRARKSGMNEEIELIKAEKERFKKYADALEKEIKTLQGCVAFSERIRIFELLKSCCNEFNRGNWLYGRPPCNRNGIEDKDRRCTMRGTCPVYAEIMKGAEK